MPLVIIRRDADRFHSEAAKKLVEDLPAIVARALSSKDPGGELTGRDVEVWDTTKGYFDANVKALEIVIWTNLYPERQKNLDERQELIRKAVRAIIPKDIEGFVWVLLAPGSFGEF